MSQDNANKAIFISPLVLWFWLIEDCEAPLINWLMYLLISYRLCFVHGSLRLPNFFLLFSGMKKDFKT